MQAPPKSILKFVTPPNKTIYLALVNLAFFGILPGTWASYSFCLVRGDYPVHADSISIPIFSDAIMFVIVSPFINIGAYILLYFAKLPARLVMPFDFSPINLLCSLVCVAVTCFLTWDLVDEICYALPGGMLLIPPYALMVYLCLSLRAGLLNGRTKT